MEVETNARRGIFEGAGTSGSGENGVDRGHAQVKVGGGCGNPSHVSAKPTGEIDSEPSIAV